MRRSRGLRIVSVIGLLVLSGCVGAGQEPNPDAAADVDGDLEIHHIDVGQADATLLVTPAGETILIDTGDWRENGADVIEYLERRNVDRIDHLIATHAHADHIGGHAAVIEHFERNRDGVGAAYDSGVVHTSQSYENYLDAVETHGVRLFHVTEGDTIPLESDAVEATVLNPPADEPRDDLHANSVVLAVEFGSFSYLTTGGAEREAEARLVDDHADALDADVYQVGHHGSSSSSTPPFLAAVDPDIAVVSSALDSQYGHPHDEVLEALADRGARTYWTGVHGTVVVRTDGDAASVTTERGGPTDPEALRERKRDGGVSRSVDRPRGPFSQPGVDGPAARTGG